MTTASKAEVPCPVCGSGRYKVRHEPWVEIADPAALYGAASGVPGTQRLVDCLECGMVFENPRFPDDVILAGYRGSSEAGHDSQHEMRVDSFYRTLLSLKDKLPPAGARVLDVGTAGGAFLEAAARFAYRPTGLEPSAYLAEAGRRRGLDVRQGTIDAHDFSPGGFDIVSLWDVIEHLTDPKGALEKIRPLLKPGGLLLINYPDIGTWGAALAGKRFWWIISVHLHHFTRATLARLCRDTGFEVFHFQRYWQYLAFGYLQDMAIHYKIPGAGLFKRLTPGALQRRRVKYHASQTTALARLAR